MDFNEFINMSLMVISESKNNIILFLMTIPASLILGFLVTLVVRSKIKPIKWLGESYIFILRGTPLMLQLLFVCFGLPFIPGIGQYLIFDRFECALIAFVLNYAAYFAEIFRGGLLAVDKGQSEAAKVLGISKFNTVTHIIIPQMLRVSMPAVGNEIITLIKDTSLVFTIALPDIIKSSKDFVNATSKPYAYLVAGVFFLIFVFVLTHIFKYIEKKMKWE